MKLNDFTVIFDKLRRLLNRRQKFLLLILFVLTIIMSVLETFGITAIMPFIAVATDMSVIDRPPYKSVYDFFGFDSKINFAIIFGFCIFIFYVIRGLYTVGYTYLISRFGLGTYRYFAGRLFRTILNIPYKVYVRKNSAELINIINGETQNMNNLLMSILNMFSELFTVCMLYVFIFVTEWKMTLVLSLVILLIVLFIFKFIVRKTKEQGRKRAEGAQKLNRTLLEAFGNFRFVKLKNSEERSISKFDACARTMSNAQVLNNTLGNLPRVLLEASGFSMLIGCIIYILWKDHSAERIIPLLAMYTITLYRLLPSVTRVLNNVNTIVFSKAALDIVSDNMHQPVENEGDKDIIFESSIRIDNISFNYVPDKTVLHNVSLEIKKGEKVAITGESGGGKSTLADLIIGINKPEKGVIYIDGAALTNENIRSWRKKTGYIPQSIYLYDGTVGENVAFGSEFNEERIIKVLKMANIWDYLQEKEGINSKVGEGGVQLSGGQRQRIGIARALYDDPEILVLDEATSALDTETETRIMDEIYRIGADRTLIIIAHRLSTIERCSRRIHVDHGRISEA